MKYSFPAAVCIALLFISSSCLSSSKNTQPDGASHREYIVQFMEGTSKERVEAVLSQHGISRSSYLTSSRDRGYILLIELGKARDDVLQSLEQEPAVKHIDPNYTRSIDKE